MPSYTPKGVCATNIEYDIDDEGRVRGVSFTRGCAGNALGVARLVEGRPAKEIIGLLADTPCGNKGTSCPAQLAKALGQHLELGQTDS